MSTKEHTLLHAGWIIVQTMLFALLPVFDDEKPGVRIFTGSTCIRALQISRHIMTSHIDRFRRIALALPGAIESSHMGNPDFRIDGRIFATLSAQATGRGVLKLTVEQQQSFITEMPAIFEPVPGGWGRMGMTFVDLKADKSTLEGALSTAYKNIKAKQANKKAWRSDADKPTRRRLQ